MGSVTITLEAPPSANDLRELLDGVRAFNRALSGNERPRPVACFLRDRGTDYRRRPVTTLISSE